MQQVLKLLILFFGCFHSLQCRILQIKKAFSLNIPLKALIDHKKASIPTVSLISDNEETFEEIISSFLSTSNGNLSVQIESFEKAQKAQTIKKAFVVIFVDNLEKIENFSKQVKHESFKFNGYYLIVIDEKSEIEMKKVFEMFWKKFIFNVNIFRIDKSSYKGNLFTFLPFKENSCDDVTPVMINEFDRKWKTDIFFPKKFKNLNKCPIKAGTVDIKPAVIVGKFNKTSGFEIDILNNFATSLNFSVHFTLYPPETMLKIKNNSVTQLMAEVYNRKVDLIFGLYSLQKSRMDFLSETKFLYFDSIIAVVPPAVLIGSLQKLLLPFDFFTWIALSVVLSISIVVIFFLKLCFKKHRDFIVGRNTRNHFLNLWNVILGGSLHNLPQKNFARFLLMCFVIFCLIIRSSYTGSLFNNIRKDISEREIKSISELDEMEYTFYVYESLADRLNDVKGMKRKEKI